MTDAAAVARPLYARGAVLGLAAAALFGASAPLAKALLPGFGPWWLAALLYSGAAVALTLWRLAIPRRADAVALTRRDIPRLLGITVLVGVAGPLLMLAGLALAGMIEPSAPPTKGMAAALVLGAFSYGVSVVLDAHALRILGAAREAAFFATAPFAGAVLAIAVRGERPGWV